MHVLAAEFNIPFNQKGNFNVKMLNLAKDILWEPCVALSAHSPH